MAKRKRLSISEQRAIIAERLGSNLPDSELTDDREKSMNFYYGRPLGNEVDGRAQVVSKDLMDTVEWIMPSLMRVFCVQQAVQFDPVGPEDELLAKQETAYVSHVLWKKNPGFMVIYEWLKSALLQKNGYVQYWWQDEEKLSFDSYEGLTDDQLTLTLESLAEQGEVEVVGYEQADDGSHAIKVRIKKTYGCAKVAACPPEEIIVERNCRGSIKTAKFVARLRRNVSRSELIEEGHDRAKVMKLTSYDYRADMAESMARDSVGENSANSTEGSADRASDSLELLQCWTYLDADGDGIAELRSYLLAGNDELENTEVNEIQLESWTPTPVPFRHYGLSEFDMMEDLQRIKTALQRGILDNVYFTMNPRMGYSRDVDVGSLQVNRPGGHVLVNVNGPIVGHLIPMPVAPIAASILPVVDYIDAVKETRVGVGRMTSGVDADVLAQSTKGAYTDAKAAANQRIEAIARIFAETGYASLYMSLHKLLMHHQDWQSRFKLRDQWVEVNPTEWQERANMTVAVGLGNASKEEIRGNLTLMGVVQEKAAAVPGLVQPNNVFALARRAQVELGFENEDFLTDPKSPEYKAASQSAPPPDPYLEGEKIKAQQRAAENQTNAQLKVREQDQEMALEITKLEVESGLDLAKAGIGAEVAVARGTGAPRQGGAGAPAGPATP